MEKIKQTPIQFPILKVWLSYILLCEPLFNHPPPLSEPAFPVFLQHFITCCVLISFFVCLSPCWTVRLRAKNISISPLVLPAENSLPWPYFKPQVRYHLSRKPVLTHLIWINPPPLCYLLPYANFYLSVHHAILLSPVYLFLHRDAELLEVRNCVSKCSAKGPVHRRISIMAYWKIFS